MSSPAFAAARRLERDHARLTLGLGRRSTARLTHTDRPPATPMACVPVAHRPAGVLAAAGLTQLDLSPLDSTREWAAPIAPGAGGCAMVGSAGKRRCLVSTHSSGRWAYPSCVRGAGLVRMQSGQGLARMRRSSPSRPPSEAPDSRAVWPRGLIRMHPVRASSRCRWAYLSQRTLARALSRAPRRSAKPARLGLGLG